MRKYALAALKLALTFGLIFYIVRATSLKFLLESLTSINPAWIILTGLFWMAQMSLSALRWNIFIRAQGIVLSFWNCFKLYYVSCLISVAMPATIGMDAARAKLLVGQRVPVSAAIRSVLKDRLLSTMAIVIMVVISLPVLLWLINDKAALAGLSLAVVMLAGAIASALYGERVWARIPWIGKHLALISVETRALLKDIPMALKITTLGILIQLLVALEFWSLGQAAHFIAPWYGYFALVPAISVLITLPVTINGWGMRETALYKGFALIGIASPLAVTVSILFGLVNTIMSLGATPVLIQFSFLAHVIDFGSLKAQICDKPEGP